MWPLNYVQLSLCILERLTCDTGHACQSWPVPDIPVKRWRSDNRWPGFAPASSWQVRLPYAFAPLKVTSSVNAVE